MQHLGKLAVVLTSRKVEGVITEEVRRSCLWPWTPGRKIMSQQHHWRVPARNKQSVKRTVTKQQASTARMK